MKKDQLQASNSRLGLIFKIGGTFILSLCLSVYGIAQPWNYDLGTGTGTHNSGFDLNFLPVPPAGTDRVSIGTGGSINLENPGQAGLGSDTEIRAEASSSTIFNKISVYDYAAGKTCSMSFEFILGESDGTDGANDGTWFFAIGDGNSFSGSGGLNFSQTFLGLRFDFDAGGLTATIQYNDNGTWVNTGLTTTSLTQGVKYRIDVFGNNSTSDQTYLGGTQAVPVDKFDLWLDNVLIGDNLDKSFMANDLDIDSWLFSGFSSTGNVANIFLDEIEYSNSLDITALPVELSAFTATPLNNQAIQLNWTTATELNNDFFTIERSENGIEFAAVGEVLGAGTTLNTSHYEFIDQQPIIGTAYYRLRQTDYDGTFTISKIIPVTISEKELQSMKLQSNVVNTHLQVIFPTTMTTNTVEIYDLMGRNIASFSDFNTKSTQIINVSNLSSGAYFVRMKMGNQFVTEQFVKL